MSKKSIINIDKICNSVPGKIYYKESTESTNTDAKSAEDAPDKSLFISDSQSKGRGRMGRDWSSPAGLGIWMSILLKPEIQLDYISQLTLIAGLAVTRAIKNTTIKWPNDILFGDKKLAGILTEMSFESDTIKNVVVGIGINVNNEIFPEEIKDKATSLFIETGKETERETLINDILAEFFTMYDEFLEKGFSAFKDEYTKKCVTLKKDVYILKNDKIKKAKAISITQSGELLIEKDGEREVINSYEVSVRGLLGYS